MKRQRSGGCPLPLGISAEEAQDTNFHSSDCDLAGPKAAERAERDRIRQFLHKQYAERFGPVRSPQTPSVNKPTGDERRVERVRIEGWDAPRVERALQEVSVSSVHEGMADEICGIDSEGRQFYAMHESLVHTCPIPEPGTVAPQTPLEIVCCFHSEHSEVIQSRTTPGSSDAVQTSFTQINDCFTDV